MNLSHVVLVDSLDREIGTMEKLEAHKRGLLHRAFSVFLFDQTGRMLIHRRAQSKYHSGGLWTNACCSHPLPGETIEDAAVRRVSEELGITATPVRKSQFIYRCAFENGLVEHELDHVLSAEIKADVDIQVHPEEVADWQFIKTDALSTWLDEKPDEFTVWFRLAWDALRATP